jgi:hypothetical protein
MVAEEETLRFVYAALLSTVGLPRGLDRANDGAATVVTSDVVALYCSKLPVEVSLARTGATTNPLVVDARPEPVALSTMEFGAPDVSPSVVVPITMAKLPPLAELPIAME